MRHGPFCNDGATKPQRSALGGMMSKKKAIKKTKSKKATKKKSAKKTAKKPAKKTAKKRSSVQVTSKAKSASKKILSHVDQTLMSMAVQRYENIFNKISQQSTRLNEDRKMALEVGQRVLKKVKDVKSSITKSAMKRSRIDLALMGLSVKKSKSKKASAKNA